MPKVQGRNGQTWSIRNADDVSALLARIDDEMTRLDEKVNRELAARMMRAEASLRIVSRQTREEPARRADRGSDWRKVVVL